MLKDGRIGKGEAVLKLTPAVRAEIENRAFNEGIDVCIAETRQFADQARFRSMPGDVAAALSELLLTHAQVFNALKRVVAD
jgi:hypothetical protein